MVVMRQGTVRASLEAATANKPRGQLVPAAAALYLVRRLATILLTLLITSVVVFVIVRMLPGDAAQVGLGQAATPQALAALRARFGLDQPVYMQYLHWAWGILHGDLGTSIRTSLPLSKTLVPALGRSALLAAFAMALTILVALPAGVVSALNRGRPLDMVVSLFSYIGISVPEFLTATLLLILLANPAYGLFPTTGYVSLSEDLWSGLQHLALPVLTASVVITAHVARMIRSELIDVLHTDYIKAARVKGLSSARIVLRHALPNALLPAITILAMDVGYLLGGIIVIEEVFAYPGLGRELFVSIENRDLPAIQAASLFIATAYLASSFVADVLYATLDKRIKLV
jgi:peptide/nickel transport system permease protein